MVRREARCLLLINAALLLAHREGILTTANLIVEARLNAQNPDQRFR